MVNMNEDFGAYKDSIWKGLTARELGVMAVSAVSCGIIIILLYFILGWNLYISFLIGTAVAAAIIFSQVWKSRSGLSAIEFYRARKYRKSTAKLVWKSDEYNQARKNYLKKENNDREKSRRFFIYLERMEQNGTFFRMRNLSDIKNVHSQFTRHRPVFNKCWILQVYTKMEYLK